MMKQKEKNKSNTIIIEKANGLGWTFNFYNKWSYAVLIFVARFGGCSDMAGQRLDRRSTTLIITCCYL